MSKMEKPSELAHAGQTDASISRDVSNKDSRRKRMVTVVRWLSIALILAALLMIVRLLPIGQAMEAMKAG